MANRIYIPFINPSAWWKEGQTNLPQYFHKYPDDYPFEETQQQPWDSKTTYAQKWQQSDIIRFQFTSNFSAIQIKLFDCYDIERRSFNATQVRSNKYVPGWYVYEVSIALNTVPEGIYKLRMYLGDDIWFTPWYDIREKWPNTIYFEYRNSRYHGDVLFETGITFNFRIEGTIKRPTFGSRDTLFENQPGNSFVLSSRSNTNFPFSIGGSRGIPSWAERIHHLIWSCNDVKADGRPQAKSTETKIEVKSEGRWPMVGLSYTVRDGLNRGSKIAEPNLNTNIKLVQVAPLEGTVFGDLALGASSNIITVLTTE